MDVEWQAVATGMGHNATIVAQTALDDLAALAGTDVLIVPSGVIALPADRVQAIRECLQQQGPVCLQREYLRDHEANLAFADLVTSLGGGFATSGTTAGDLNPMVVSGTLASDPNAVPSPPYFWYGCTGGGDATVTAFLTYGGRHFGWIFSAPLNDAHRLIQTTDQDWVRLADSIPASAALMENILTYLLESAPVPTDVSSRGAVKVLYRD